MLSGGKRVTGARSVTIVGATASGRRVVSANAGKGDYEPLKIHIIRPSGQVERGKIHLDMGPVKKSSRPLRPIEKALRKLVRAEHKALGRYLLLHERSRRRERNGWASDLGKNLVKVIRG